MQFDENWSQRTTNGLSDSRVLEQTREDRDVMPDHDSLNALPAGNVGVCHVAQAGGDESGIAGEHRCLIATIEDMVRKNSLDSRGVVGLDDGTGGAVQELRKGLIRRGENCDVLGHCKGRGEEAGEGCQVGQVRVACEGGCQVHCLRGGSGSQGREREKFVLHNCSSADVYEKSIELLLQTP